VQEPAEEKNPRPTTQELLTGPRNSLRLHYFPLSVQAPESWKITSMAGGDLVFVEGPAPAGDDVQIQLSHRGVVPDQQFDRRHAATTREAANANVMRSEVRSFGEMKILEHQSLGKEPVTLTDRSGKPMPQTVNLKWNVHVFIHRPEGGYESYELNFVGLTADQYEKDKDFLRGIVESVKHDPHPSLPDAAVPEVVETSPTTRATTRPSEGSVRP
jgi:hypothetical protein